MAAGPVCHPEFGAGGPQEFQQNGRNLIEQNGSLCPVAFASGALSAIHRTQKFRLVSNRAQCGNKDIAKM
jgi:hypothetical protein